MVTDSTPGWLFLAEINRRFSSQQEVRPIPCTLASYGPLPCAAVWFLRFFFLSSHYSAVGEETLVLIFEIFLLSLRRPSDISRPYSSSGYPSPFLYFLCFGSA